MNVQYKNWLILLQVQKSNTHIKFLYIIEYISEIIKHIKDCSIGFYDHKIQLEYFKALVYSESSRLIL